MAARHRQRHVCIVPAHPRLQYTSLVSVALLPARKITAERGGPYNILPHARVKVGVSHEPCPLSFSSPSIPVSAFLRQSHSFTEISLMLFVIPAVLTCHLLYPAMMSLLLCSHPSTLLPYASVPSPMPQAAACTLDEIPHANLHVLTLTACHGAIDAYAKLFSATRSSSSVGSSPMAFDTPAASFSINLPSVAACRMCCMVRVG